MWSRLHDPSPPIQVTRPALGFPDSLAGKESAWNAGDAGLGRSTAEGIGYPLQYSWASPVAQLVKSLSATCRPGFNLWAGKIPWRRERLPTPIFWPGEFHGLYSPWGRKESDTTERLSLSLCTNEKMRLQRLTQAGVWGSEELGLNSVSYVRAGTLCK